MPLGDGALDSSALPDDFLIAEAYKRQRKIRSFFSFLVSWFLPDEAIWCLGKSIDHSSFDTDEQTKRGDTLKARAK
jgi:hypothetical protein